MISFFVPGSPQTKGSSRAFVVKGRAVVTNDNPKEKDWRNRVAILASEAMLATVGTDGGSPPMGPWKFPVSVFATFYLQRPQGHYGKRGLRPGAPRLPGVKPDADKLARSLLDALEKIVYHHDALVTTLMVDKVYADEGHPPGVQVSVCPAGQEPYMGANRGYTRQEIEAQEFLPGTHGTSFEDKP